MVGSTVSDTAYLSQLSEKGQQLNDIIAQRMKDFKGANEISEKLNQLV